MHFPPPPATPTATPSSPSPALSTTTTSPALRSCPSTSSSAALALRALPSSTSRPPFARRSMLLLRRPQHLGMNVAAPPLPPVPSPALLNVPARGRKLSKKAGRGRVRACAGRLRVTAFFTGASGLPARLGRALGGREGVR